MAKAKFYAVRTGKKPGVYTTWEECSTQVEGFKGAKYKSFDNAEDAKRFINGEIDYDYGKNAKAGGSHSGKHENTPDIVPPEDVYCFVDGSYNSKTNVYGCGGFLMANGVKYIIQESASDEEAARHRNISGEVLGAIRAVEKAMELGLKEITIYHDYNGICGWANGWKTNIKLTQDYKAFMDNARKHINIKFRQVPGHVGIHGNEEADRLAKEAVGIDG